MDTLSVLKLGEKFSKKELSKFLNEPSLSTIREGLYHCKNTNSTLLFVDLEKQDKEERFHFNDFFDGEYFHWDSQTTQHINSPKIQEIINNERIPHLFVRINQKIKNKTQPFVYCGRLIFNEYEKETSKPIHIIFQNIDYDDFTDNEDIMDIYLWKPEKKGRVTSSKIVKRSLVSIERERKYRKPNETERNGLVTSRVGQGYYRQQIIEKWNGICPITNCDIKEILISSHIIPWSECNYEERLDVDNGILLSPNVDSLFDKHLISFSDNGEMLISKKISNHHIEQLGINGDIKLDVTDGMKKYLEKHRQVFNINK